MDGCRTDGRRTNGKIMLLSHFLTIRGVVVDGEGGHVLVNGRTPGA